jgi:shikimate dehydrogenase
VTTKLLLGLVGAGIQRSLTPALHEAEGRHHGLALHDQLIDLDHAPGAWTPADLPGLVAALRTIGFAGFNVTFPCKQSIIPLLDGLSDEARAMGAVNTVVADGGRLVGHNTDGAGWADGLKRQLPDADLSCVVLVGAGGAGSAIGHAALDLGAGRVLVHDTDAGRAERLAAELAQAHGAGCAAAAPDLAAALAQASGVVHATPVGMDKLPGLPFPTAWLTPRLWVSEIVYFPLETALVKAARAAGCRVADGGGMAVGQAVRAFRLFTGREPDAARMDAHFRRLLAERREPVEA